MSSVGDTLTTKIDYIDSFENGVVQIEDQIINVGPVSSGSEGERVKITIVQSSFGYCHTESVKKSTYLEDFESFLRGDVLAGEKLNGMVATVEAKGHPEGLSRRPTVDFWDTEVEIRGAKVGETVKIKVRHHSEDGAVADVISKKPKQPKGINTLDFIQNLDQSDIDKILHDLHILDEVGVSFTANIVNIDGSNIGSIEPVSGHRLKIGPVSGEIGEEVRVEYKGNGYAKCLKEEIWKSHYLNRFHILSGDVESLPIDIGGVFTAKVTDVYDESSIVEYQGIHINIMTTDIEEEQLVKVKVTGFASQSANGKLLEKVEPAAGDKKKDNQEHKDKVVQEEKTPKEESQNLESFIQGRIDTKNLNKLRKEAVDDSSSSVSTYSSEKSQNIHQYNRSRKVKEYVKARAEGVCEGCDRPAPFRSKTGEPYLHAHHIHELSNGGSDSPETVIALCPNCHYRVHHGEDGEEYNQELLEKVQLLETSE